MISEVRLTGSGVVVQLLPPSSDGGSGAWNGGLDYDNGATCLHSRTHTAALDLHRRLPHQHTCRRASPPPAALTFGRSRHLCMQPSRPTVWWV